MPQWIREACDEGAYRAWVQEGLDRVGNEAWASKGAEAINWPGATLDDYHEKIVEVAGVRHVIGIRFRGGSREQPFVDAYICDSSIEATDWPALLTQAQKEYALFRPSFLRRLRWLREDEGDSELATPGWELDQLLVTATLDSLTTRATEKIERMGRDGLGTISQVQVYELEEAAKAVKQMHEWWQKERPWMRGSVSPQSQASLEAALEKGVAVSLRIEGQIIAVAFAIAQSEFRSGCSGISMYEKVVTPGYARRGLSHALHAALVIELRKKFDGGTLLYGMIDARNKPSIANAFRAGRRPAAVLEILRA